ncbi:MAG: alpha/beta hydrolase family protein [Gemmatimonadaceae bacterium]
MLIAALHRRGIRCPRWSGMSLAVFAGLALAAGVALAQAPRSYGFIFLIGSDTLGVERVTSGAAQMAGDIQMRGQPRLHWTGTVAAPGRVTSVVLTAFRSAAPDAALMQRAVVVLDRDTARVEISSTGPVRRQTLASKRDAFLFVNASAAMIDLLLERARATPAPVDTFPVFLTTGGQTIDSYVRIWGDSASVSLAGQVSRIGLTPTGHVREAVLAAQNLRMVRVEGPAYESLKLGSPDYGAPAGAPYTAQHVRIDATGGHQLAATLTRPTGVSGRVPAVVTISGSGPQDRDEYIPLVPGFRPFRQLADTLGRRGIAVLRYDDRGTGESGGSFAGSTSADFANDVRSLVRWLRARPEVDPRRIFLLGHSEGGLIAPMVAADDPSLAGIVLLAGPAKNGLDIVRFQQRYAIEHDTSLRAPARRDSAIAAANKMVDQLAAGDAWMKFFFSYDPLATARKVRVPAFVVQGGSDQQVTADQAEPLGAALRASDNADVSVRIFPDLNHLFLPDPTGNPANYVRLTSGRIGSEVMGPIVDWLLQRIGR